MGLIAPDDLLRDLNNSQLDAVTAPDGPLLVLSGAGSGKTRVIAHRIAYLLAGCGVSPRNVLAVTFTNKAAEEMARRVETLTESMGIRAPLIATFHSVCVRILRQHIKHLGYTPHFTIYDEDDRLSVVKECMREQKLDERTLTASALAHRISHAKNQMQSPDDVEQAARGQRQESIAAVYRAYQERLRAADAVDFDDLLLLTVKLFEHVPEVLAWYRGLWRHVLVDEYQDTNRAQYRLIRLLTSEHGNICVVGDGDQSVYRFRGADIRNILEFERDYPGTRIVKLEQNYRSTKRILAIAAQVIANNIARKEKTLWTENAEGERALLYRAWDEHEEANFVAQTVLKARGEGVGYQDIAVFYRTNAQSRVLEDAFRRGGIPYVIVGGVKFYERKEVKDTLAYLRLIVNPADDVAFRRAVGAPARGVGRVTLTRLEELAAREKRAMLDVAQSPPADVRGAGRKALVDFATLVGRLRFECVGMTLPALIDHVLESSGYREALKAERSSEADARLENLEELVAAAEDYERGDLATGLEGFLDTIALVSDVDEMPEGRQGVTLMTLHSAKGLEFPLVFLTGLEEGVFPHARSLNDTADIEEERRLCYVGLTRAKARLVLSYALHRRLHGYELGQPSRFLREMPEEHLHLVNAARAERSATFAPEASRFEPHLDEDFPLKVGARVRHGRFGDGFVVGVEREGDDTVVTVRFASVGRKRLSLQYTRLEEL